MYTTLVTTIETLVASVDSSPFKIYPVELQQTISDEKFILFDIITSEGTRSDYSNKMVSGIIIFSLFYPYTFSKRNIANYCETILDPVFEDCLIEDAAIQLRTSSLQFLGRDGNGKSTGDATRLRADYSIPYKVIGET